MVRKTQLSMRTAVLALSAVTAVAGAGFIATSSESILRQSFAQGLKAAPQYAERKAKSAPEVGSEDYWLSAMSKETSGALKYAVSVGDQISMSLGGIQRTLEVQSVTPIQPTVTTVDVGSKPASHLVMVSARDIAAMRDLGKATLVRFFIEIEGATAPVTTATEQRGL